MELIQLGFFHCVLIEEHQVFDVIELNSTWCLMESMYKHVWSEVIKFMTEFVTHPHGTC